MSRSELSIIVAGAILLVLGLAWARYSARRRTSAEGLRAALHAPEANERIAGLMLAASDGISKNAPWLLTVARSDDDPTVLDALARIVAQHQWEPATRPEAIELRLWAREYLAGGQRRTAAPAATASDWPSPAPLEKEPEPVQPPAAEGALPSPPAPGEVTALLSPPALAPFVPVASPPLPPVVATVPPVVAPPPQPQFVPPLPASPEFAGFPSRHELLERLEAYERDLEQQLAGIADLIVHLRDRDEGQSQQS